MFTQCPQCDAIFQLSASQLAAANGEVRCGQCLSVFSALENLSEAIPPSPEDDSEEALAQEAERYRDWSSQTTAAKPPSEPQADQLLATENDDHNDVFNEVIAEVGTQAIPAEEIDRFEAFLETPVEELTLSEEAQPDAQATSDTAFEAEIADPSPSEQAEHPPLADPQAAPNDDLSTDTALGDDEIATPETSLADSDDINFAEQETASAGLDSKSDDDEFAELDAYLHDADSQNAGDKTEVSDLDLTVDFRHDDEEFAELDAYLNDTKHEADKRIDTDSDSDKIIISAADLAPMDSPAYSDAPDSARQTSADTDPDKAGHEAAPGTQANNIPRLILDDLHAARDEQLRPSNTPWIIGSLLLMFTLVVQVVYATRDELAKDASLRPWLISLCNVTGCTLTQPYDLKQIDIIGREVRSHPDAARALIASTTLINNADFVQPFPLLTVVFSDINGKPLAQRRFTPREYLDNNADLDAGMTPDLPVRIELELVDPGKAAVNYEFHTELDPRKTRPLT